MGKKKSKGVPEIVPVPIVWNPEMPSTFANQMLVNTDGKEVHLHFFEIAPPLIFGTDEQKQEQIDSLKSVVARGVIRVVMNKDRLPGLIKALQTILDKVGDNNPPQNGHKGRKGK